MCISCVFQLCVLAVCIRLTADGARALGVWGWRGAAQQQVRRAAGGRGACVSSRGLGSTADVVHVFWVYKWLSGDCFRPRVWHATCKRLLLHCTCMSDVCVCKRSPFRTSRSGMLQPVYLVRHARVSGTLRLRQVPYAAVQGCRRTFPRTS